MDPDLDFSGSDPDFQPIRIRTQKKSSNGFRKKNRIQITLIVGAVKNQPDMGLELLSAHKHVSGLKAASYNQLAI